jgi:hypothetical protein
MADETKSNEKVPGIDDKKNAVNIATGKQLSHFSRTPMMISSAGRYSSRSKMVRTLGPWAGSKHR